MTDRTERRVRCAAVVLYRLISFGFIIGAGWLIWLAIRYRYRHHDT